MSPLRIRVLGLVVAGPVAVAACSTGDIQLTTPEGITPEGLVDGSSGDAGFPRGSSSSGTTSSTGSASSSGVVQPTGSGTSGAGGSSGTSGASGRSSGGSGSPSGSGSTGEGGASGGGPDAEQPAEAGALSIACGLASCNPATDVCCITTGGASSCSTAATCRGQVLTCSGSESCTGGDVCCGQLQASGSLTTSCAPACASGDVRICSNGSDCKGPCRQGAAGYGTCASTPGHN